MNKSEDRYDEFTKEFGKSAWSHFWASDYAGSDLTLDEYVKIFEVTKERSKKPKKVIRRIIPKGGKNYG